MVKKLNKQSAEQACHGSLVALTVLEVEEE
jgi:hypothetical protein